MQRTPFSRPHTAIKALVLGAAILVPVVAAAQDTGMPTPEEYAALAEASQNAPLFATHEPLVMTLSTRIDWIRDERSDEEEADGTVTYVADDGSEVTVDVEVRARGNFRRDKRNCNFPPLRLDFPRSRVAGTVFAGQNRLKLVSPCHDSRDDFQQYVYQEYLAYRTHNLLSPYSFRVRLVEITYEDTDEEYDTRTKMGFLIEADEPMAQRNRSTFLEVPQLHPATMDAEGEIMASLFNFMIANTDWSPAFFHNVILLRTEDGRFTVVPYDFDFSGVVNARYATPAELVRDRIRRVTQRLYRGFCRPELTRERWAAVFNEQKDAIWALYQGFELLEEDELEDALEFYDEFYEIMNDDRQFDREIIRDCREIPG